MQESLTQKTLHGLKWSYISTVSTAVMQIGYTAVMARLLNPSDFGLVAMGGVVLRFGSYFAQMGMSSALIQKKDLTKEQVSAAFTSSIMLGFLFTLLTIVLAPLSKFIFNSPEIVPIVKLMGLSFFINGFSLTALALIRRKLRFKSLAIAETVSFMIGYLVIGIGSAFLGLGVWSLVLASLSQSALISIIAFFIIRHDLNLSFSLIDYKPLFSFGSKVSVLNFFEFLGYSAEPIFIGRFFGDTTMGYYNRAQMIINLPISYLINSISKVIYPSLCQIQDDIDRLKRNFFLIFNLSLIVLLPFSIMVFTLSREIVLILLGQKWIQSIILLKVLAFAATFDYLQHLIGITLESKGILKERIYIQIVYPFLLSSVIIYFKSSGIVTVAVIVLIFYILRFFSYLFILRKIEIRILEFFSSIFYDIISSLIFFVAITIFYTFLHVVNSQVWFDFVLSVLFSLLVYLSILYLPFNNGIRNKSMGYFKILLKNLFG